MNCTKEEFANRDGKCCDQCAAGFHMEAQCDGTRKTKCAQCKPNFYTATMNYLTTCHRCTYCSSSEKKKTLQECEPHKDRVCECKDGYYCNNDQCEHCLAVKECTLGWGVKEKASRTSDTTCAPCANGTYSNVTDRHSACQPHTRCEVFGRELKTNGTSVSNAVCGNFKQSPCLPNLSDQAWMLPAGLWSGLVLTLVLVLIGLICWRMKRKLRRATEPSVTCEGNSRSPVTLIEMVPAATTGLLELPLPSMELHDHCQESCVVDGCKLPIFTPDDSVVCYKSEDSVVSSLPITPLKVSVSFAEDGCTNGSVGHGTANYFRTHSEPQEDEWCDAY